LVFRGNITDLLLIDNYENLTHAELCELIRIYKDYIKANINVKNNNITVTELGSTVNKLNTEIYDLKLQLKNLETYKNNYKTLYDKLTRKLTVLERLQGKLNLKLLNKE
jgi:predicted RNase H-like nuclease (RuvC/YqgF family)